MSTQTPQEQAELFRNELRADLAEIRDELHSIRAEVTNTRAELEAMREGLTHAATPPAATVGTFTQMEITSVVFNVDKNDKPVYMALGIPYHEFGVRIWEEVMPLLDLDPANFKAGRNIIKPPIVARVLLGETTNQKTGKVGIGPRKVTGKI